MKTISASLLVGILCRVLTPVDLATAQGTTFTYQGRLTSGTNVANGVYDFEFMIYNTNAAGNVIGGPLTSAATGVTNGVFTVTLDFGSAPFDGNTRWLELGVRTNDGGAFITLTPRQPLTATPYAIRAGNLSGVLPAAGLSGTYGGTLTLSNPANSFSGSGAGLTALNAAQLTSGTMADGRLSTNVALLNTSPVFAGTVTAGGDVAGARLRIGSSHNLTGVNATIAGGLSNTNSGLAGTVGGGQNNTANANYAALGGGQNNTVSGVFAAVAGGQNNIASGLLGAIGGGQSNVVSSSYATIPGGRFNTANNTLATVSGGQNNTASRTGAAIGGGGNNFAAGDYGTIGGGDQNTVSNAWATVSGGQFNSARGNYATVGGGEQNTASQVDATVGGGYANTASGASATVAGGFGNHASDNFTGNAATVGGGSFNTASGEGATVPGGKFNVATNRAFAAGYRAKALHDGTFVWADWNAFDFVSTAANQFLIRASSGVGIGTADTTHSLTVLNGITDKVLRLIGPDSAFGEGAKLNFGDGNFVYLDEYADDLLRIQANRVGVGRDAASNRLEVEGDASKTTAGGWLANSDARIKQDIQAISQALATLDRVRPVSFRYTDDYRATHPGVESRRYLNVVAQEFREVFPDVVKSSGEKLPNGEEILQVDTYPLILYSVAAIQELNRDLKQKDTEIAELKQRLEMLEQMMNQKNRSVQ